MPSLNAFDIRDQWYAKPCVSLSAFDVRDHRYARRGVFERLSNASQNWSQSYSVMFDLALDRDKVYDKFIRYLIPPLTCVKHGVKVRITFASSLSRIKLMHRQGIFDAH